MSENDFSRFFIKDYKLWTVGIHENQCYLGRCVVWCKREDALDLADATPAEQAELFMILHDLREAVKKIFQPDWFNYAFLGNGTRHLHGHFIPRYAIPRTFRGVVFTDERYGHNYRTDYTFNIQEKILMEIKNKILVELK